MAERTQYVIDDGALHRYRTEIPNTVVRGLKGRGLSVYAKWLYVYLKSVAGDTGECRQSTTTLAEGSGLSRAQVSRERQALLTAGLLHLEYGASRNRDTAHIRITDIWLPNMQEFASFGVSTGNTAEGGEVQTPGASEAPGVSTGNTGVSTGNTGVSTGNTGVSTGNTTLIGRRRSLEEDLLKKKDTGYSAAFLTFWDAYPRKVKKGDAWTAWVKGKCDGIADVIVASIADHRQHDADWQRDGGQYIPHPTTYLHNRRWEDELQAATGRKPHSGRVAL